MTRPEKSEEPKGYEQPARLREEHVALNPEAPERWRRYVVVDDHPLTKAFLKGQLDNGRRGHTARDRLEAGLIYRDLYDRVHTTSVSGSNFNRVTGGSGHERISENIQAARDLYEKLTARLSKDNAQIILSVCGEGRWPAEAVNGRYEGFERSVSQAFCAALDNLIDAVLDLKLYSLGRR